MAEMPLAEICGEYMGVFIMGCEVDLELRGDFLLGEELSMDMTTEQDKPATQTSNLAA